MSWHLHFLNLALQMVNVASDGVITLEEIAEVMGEHYPDNIDALMDEIKTAAKDGEITVTEALRIVAQLVLVI